MDGSEGGLVEEVAELESPVFALTETAVIIDKVQKIVRWFRFVIVMTKVSMVTRI